jgi:hypothetical protein
VKTAGALYAILFAVAGNAVPLAIAQQIQGFVLHGTAQSITLPPIPRQSAATPPLHLSAADSASRPVAFATLTPSVCKVSDNTVTYLSSGTCTVAAAPSTNEGRTEPLSVSASQIKPNFTGCVDCTAQAPTMPQWCAIAMATMLIGISIFRMRGSKALPMALLPGSKRRGK